MAAVLFIVLAIFVYQAIPTIKFMMISDDIVINREKLILLDNLFLIIVIATIYSNTPYPREIKGGISSYKDSIGNNAIKIYR